MEYTNEELKKFEIIQDDLVVELFETRDKRYAIDKAIKKAYLYGKTGEFED